jgi:hypothetical protein
VGSLRYPQHLQLLQTIVAAVSILQISYLQTGDFKYSSRNIASLLSVLFLYLNPESYTDLVHKNSGLRGKL